jgi:WD40 repeat protein
LAFSGSGAWLVTGGDDGSLRAWPLAAPGAALATILMEAGTNGVNTVAFGPQDQWLAAAGHGGLVRLWQVPAREVWDRPEALRGQRDTVSALSFSPDGRWLIAASDDGTARRWDLAPEQGRRSIALKGHTRALTALAVSHARATGSDGVGDADGSSKGPWLVTTSEDATGLLWDMARWGRRYSQLTQLACEKTDHNLSPTDNEKIFGDASYPITCADKPRAAEASVGGS